MAVWQSDGGWKQWCTKENRLFAAESEEALKDSNGETKRKSRKKHRRSKEAPMSPKTKTPEQMPYTGDASLLLHSASALPTTNLRPQRRPPGTHAESRAQTSHAVRAAEEYYTAALKPRPPGSEALPFVPNTGSSRSKTPLVHTTNYARGTPSSHSLVHTYFSQSSTHPSRNGSSASNAVNDAGLPAPPTGSSRAPPTGGRNGDLQALLSTVESTLRSSQDLRSILREAGDIPSAIGTPAKPGSGASAAMKAHKPGDPSAPMLTYKLYKQKQMPSVQEAAGGPPKARPPPTSTPDRKVKAWLANI